MQLNMVFDEMSINLYMLGPIMLHWMMYNADDNFVITKYTEWSFHWKSKFSN